MKTTNIFKGITKLKDEKIPLRDKYYFNKKMQQSLDINEILLQKLDEENYKDLATSRKYSIEEIEVDSLVPFRRIFACGKRISKHQALNLYRNHLNQKLPIKNLYIGNIGFIYDSLKEEDGYKVKISLSCSCPKKNALLLATDESFLDLESYKTYPESNICIGQMRILERQPFTRYIADEQDQEEQMTLSKVLTKYRQKIK